MKILALDTATEACSAAVLNGETITMRYEEPRRGHAGLILPMIDDVLAKSGLELRDVDVIAVGRGPGAFTGVRIAVGVAQGLAFGTGRLVVPISDLAALAQRAVLENNARRVIACIDARMDEVYWCPFEVDADQLVVPAGEEKVGPPSQVVPPTNEEWWGAGTGWALEALRDKLPDERKAPQLLPRAREIALLARRDFQAGKGVPPEQALPVYLRDQVARPPAPGNGN